MHNIKKHFILLSLLCLIFILTGCKYEKTEKHLPENQIIHPEYGHIFKNRLWLSFKKGVPFEQIDEIIKNIPATSTFDWRGDFVTITKEITDEEYVAIIEDLNNNDAFEWVMPERVLGQPTAVR